MFFVDGPFGKKKPTGAEIASKEREEELKASQTSTTTPPWGDSSSSKAEPGQSQGEFAPSPPGGFAPPPESERPHESPIPIEVIHQKTEMRIPYFEARESMELEQKEIKAVRAKIGEELREHCRPEIDEYVDCMVGRIWTVLRCKPHAREMRRCLQRIETPEFVEKRMGELLEERERNGTSLLKTKERAKYNKCYWEGRDAQTTKHDFQ